MRSRIRLIIGPRFLIGVMGLFRSARLEPRRLSNPWPLWSRGFAGIKRHSAGEMSFDLARKNERGFVPRSGYGIAGSFVHPL